MPASQVQIDKIIAALTPLFSDSDFVIVTDMNVAVTQTPPILAVEVDQVDVIKPS